MQDAGNNEMATSEWEDNPTKMKNIDYFRLLLTDEFLQVCDEYAISLFLQKGWQQESRINNWKHLVPINVTYGSYSNAKNRRLLEKERSPI